MEKINSILIVGGGSSGWMTAATLIKHYPALDITLIESSDVPTIGVGESTLGSINPYLEDLGLEDSDWMKYCNATYKTSIDFTNWDGKGTRVRYPFGEPNYLGGGFKPIDWFEKQAIMKGRKDTYHWFALGTGSMIEENKLTEDSSRIDGWDFQRDTAYHMDAGLFGDFLKKRYCIPKGVRHIVDNVVGAPLANDGSVDKILTENTGELRADLYIDCTGFKSLLLGGVLKEPLISFGEKLINDKAVAVRIPYVDKERELEHTTNATAIGAGWVWNTPLWNRIGTGYVYSSKFRTEEEAEEEFRNYLVEERDVPRSREVVDQLEALHIDISPGIRERAWVKNVCAIGLSNGFIEPLESTGLMLTHDTIFALIQALQSRDRGVTGWDKLIFNKKVRARMQNFSGFIAAHFALCERDDTEYWKYVTDEISYDYIDDPEWATLRAIAEDLTIFRNWEVFNNSSGIPFIMAGMGFNPLSEDSLRKWYRLGTGSLEGTDTWAKSIEVNNHVEKYYTELEGYIEGLDTHYQFLKRGIYKED